MLKKRNLFLCVLFSILTFGIYEIYWIVVLTNETNAAAKKGQSYSGGISVLLMIVTLGIYGLVWCYHLGQKAGDINDGGEEGVLYLILGWVTGGLIPMLLAQNICNKKAG